MATDFASNIIACFFSGSECEGKAADGYYSKHHVDWDGAQKR